MARAGVPSRRALALTWVVAAVALGAVIGAGRASRTAGDDPDPGRQRPGILDLGALPVPAPRVEGVDIPRGRRTVVFFVSERRLTDLCTALRDDASLADEAVVVVAPVAHGPCAATADVAVVDVERAASAFGLPVPRGDVAPTGYAIVDGSGRVRYRTLDPVAPSLLDEVATMLRGVR